MGNKASAHPSKAFFVEMLTRDIELGDAILDLIDNCIDGIQRRIAGTPAAKGPQPFAGFRAALKFDKKSFSIVDNCGGIPRAVAEQYAFRLGRPAGMPAEKVPTVGVYGIGMKRAMFKMGRSSVVTTVNSRKAFQVTVSSRWMDSDSSWDLPIADLAPKEVPAELKGDDGTLIHVSQLLPGVQQEFDRQVSKFEDDLKSTIATHYSYIIHKGFSITVNDAEIRPKALGILMSPQRVTKKRIDPYVYQAEVDGVTVDLVVGLYRNFPTQAEVDAELDGKASSGSRETCGWTVICNDRVVVYNDKTRLTGWGEATVPAYHPQFNAIAGIVRFQSKDMAKLPVTTTKRGLEASSDLYLAVKDVMREGLKTFTNFTNHWKSHGQERDALLAAAVSQEPLKVAPLIRKTDWSDVRRGIGGRKYVPELPRPGNGRPSTSEATIRFTRSIDDIAAVSDLLFGRSDAEPSEVGAQCFDRVLKRAKT